MKPISDAHMITIAPTSETVTVRDGDTVLAASDRALALKETGYSVVHYFPRADVAMNLLTASNRSTHCPFKGDASYFSRPDKENIAWSYEAPFDQVSAIAGYIAFFGNRLQIEVK